MPIKDCQFNNLPGYKYGDSGKCYTYKNEPQRKVAHEKAIAQAVAAGGFNEPAVNEQLTIIEKAKILLSGKISFDYDGTLTNPRIFEKAANLIIRGKDVYIISARNQKSEMYSLADKLNIPHDRIFATGSNRLKIAKIKELGITTHYDNNKDVINQLRGIGQLV